MKKINLTLIVAIMTVVNVNAQTTFGVKAGANFSSLLYSFPLGENIYEKGRTSLHFGAVAEIQISDKFSFQPELLFSSQGSRNRTSIGEWGEKHVYKLHYLTVPLMAKYYVVEGFSLEVGPQIGFLLAAKDYYTWESNGDVDSFDFGLNFGVGYKLDSPGISTFGSVTETNPSN